jgi:hypothetical protein
LHNPADVDPIVHRLWFCCVVRPASDLLDEIRDGIEAHARPDLKTPIDGLLLSHVATTTRDSGVLADPPAAGGHG